MTDTGSCDRFGLFRATCAGAEVRHLRTRPCTTRTNGKAERFIQTSLREWAYARPYQSSDAPTHALAPWITRYNSLRPHSALGGRPSGPQLTGSWMRSGVGPPIRFRLVSHTEGGGRLRTGLAGRYKQ
jgi:transposase InsO family protein